MILTPDNEYAVILDACVLYPMPLCDTLLRLAEDPSFYRPLWSDQILQEVGETLIRHGYTEAQRDRRLQFMRQFFPEAMVDVPVELVEAITVGPDGDDSHVLAAAIMSKANAIITQNTKHFPAEYLKRYGILCHNPDDFLVHQYYLSPEQILDKLDAQASDTKQSRDELLENLSKAVPRFSHLVATGNLPT
jgi:predicted nucleic acid-binding protein